MLNFVDQAKGDFLAQIGVYICLVFRIIVPTQRSPRGGVKRVVRVTLFHSRRNLDSCYLHSRRFSFDPQRGVDAAFAFMDRPDSKKDDRVDVCSILLDYLDAWLSFYGDMHEGSKKRVNETRGLDEASFLLGGY